MNAQELKRLAELGHKAQQRATAYHMLLHEVVDRVEPYWMCPYCDTRERTKSGELVHRSDCLIVRIDQTLKENKNARD